MAARVLAPPELDAMESEFETYDRRLRSEGALDVLRALAEGLVSRFPPDPTRMAEAASGGICRAR